MRIYIYNFIYYIAPFPHTGGMRTDALSKFAIETKSLLTDSEATQPLNAAVVDDT